MNRFAKRLLRTLIALLLLILLLIGAVALAVNVSPRPMAWLTQRLFASVSTATLPGYAEVSATVHTEKDVEYTSRISANRLDVFRPKAANSPLPTILWVHGGGFVGGDKSGINTWATMIAGKGYTVVSMNYALAPDSNYPNPIIQVGDVYSFLKQNERRFPTVDLNRLIVGGDSAGAQIVSQFIAMQTNPDLVKSMQTSAVVPSKHLIGAILYCGPYDIKGLHDSGSLFGRFFVRQMGWAYFGIRDWRDTAQAAQASTVNHVTSNYPPVFITDGNTGSFEADARQLEAKLKENGVYVDSLYYPLDYGKLAHEYQFDFSLPESVECYQRTLAFLEKIAR